MKRSTDKYLPIGTVVLLTGGTKRVMITGFCVRTQKDEKKMWDYTGCMYPEGMIRADQTLLFDHNQIQTIYHVGLVDDEELRFKENLEKMVEQKATSDKKAKTTSSKKQVSKPVKKKTTAKSKKK